MQPENFTKPPSSAPRQGQYKNQSKTNNEPNSTFRSEGIDRWSEVVIQTKGASMNVPSVGRFSS